MFITNLSAPRQFENITQSKRFNNSQETNYKANLTQTGANK